MLATNSNIANRQNRRNAMQQNTAPQLQIYNASAGSGKTYTLAQEYIDILISDPQSYRSILAVTFTNKATAQMKERIVKNLASLSAGDDQDLLDKQLNLAQKTNSEISREKVSEHCGKALLYILNDYGQFTVSTIDSFVQHLSRSFARELDLPGQYSVILDKDDLVEEIIKRLSDEIGKDKFISTILSNFVEYNMSEEAGWKIKKPIADFIMKLFSEDAYRKGDFKNFDSITEEKYNEIKNYVHTELKHIKDSISLIIKDIEDEESRLGITVDDYYNKSNGLPSVKNKINLS